MVMLFPLGFCLGMPFPSGIRVVGGWGKNLVPWLWGINGFTSVVGSVAAMSWAKLWGFSNVQMVGWAFYAGIFLLAVLMVSNLKFASFKELDLRRRKPFPVLLGIIVLLILIVNEPQIVLFTIGVLYTLHGPVWSFFLWRKRRMASSRADPPEETESNPGTEMLKEREESK